MVVEAQHLTGHVVDAQQGPVAVLAPHQAALLIGREGVGGREPGGLEDLLRQCPQIHRIRHQDLQTRAPHPYPVLVPRLPAPVEIRRTVVSEGSSVLLGQGVDETLDQRLRIRQVHPDGGPLVEGQQRIRPAEDVRAPPAPAHGHRHARAPHDSQSAQPYDPHYFAPAMTRQMSSSALLYCPALLQLGANGVQKDCETVPGGPWPFPHFESAMDYRIITYPVQITGSVLGRRSALLQGAPVGGPVEDPLPCLDERARAQAHADDDRPLPRRRPHHLEEVPHGC